MELYTGRPDSTEGRQQREVRVYDFLDSLELEYYRTDHADEPATNMEACEKVDKVLNATICKNLFLCNRQQTKFYMLTMPGNKPFKTKELSHQINSARLSFANEEKMLEYLDVMPGSVSLMGLMNDHDNNVQLLVDEDLLNMEWFACHPCVNTSSIKLKAKDAFGKYLDAVHHDMIVVKLTGE